MPGQKHHFSNELRQWSSTSQNSFILTGRDTATIEIKPVIAQRKEKSPRLQERLSLH